MERQLLEFQADRIEAVLELHKVPARVTGGQVSPRWIQFQVHPTLGARVNKVKGLAEELALALGSDVCRVSRRGGLLTVEIPRADPRPVGLLALQRRLAGPSDPDSGRIDRKGSQIPFGTAVLGLAEDGVPLLVRLPSSQVAHVLIAGTTGSGKSALAQTIIASLALNHRPSQIGFILIDPKRRAFGPLAGLPHMLRPVLFEMDEIADTLQMAVQLMLVRDREGRTPASSGRPGEPRVVVVIDELADLLMMARARSESAGCNAPQEALTRLAQRGREAGIHVVACTQKPASSVVGSLAKANFPVRLVGRVTSPEEAKVATGYAGTGAERLRGPGDFIAVAGGQITRFQAAYISTQELAAVVSRLLEQERGAGNPRPSDWVMVPHEQIYPPMVERTPAPAPPRRATATIEQMLYIKSQQVQPVRRLTDGVRQRPNPVATPNGSSPQET